ncbi:MAG: radical SAM protein [bacterium]
MISNFLVSSIRWDITNKCNLSCSHCYTKTNGHNELNYTQILQILEKLIPFGLKEVNFSGREPTLRDDLVNIIKWCRGEGLVVNVTTNGTKLYEKDFEHLLNTDVNLIVFSLDGAHADSNDKIRGKGGFSKTVCNIRHCTKYIKKNNLNSKIGVSFTLQKINAVECSEIINLGDNLNIDLLVINPISFCGSAIDKRSLLYLSSEEILYCWEKICKTFKEKSPKYELFLGTMPMEAKFLNAKYNVELPVIHPGCSAGKTLYITPDGKALPCYMLPPISDIVLDLKKYLNYWDILFEPQEKAIEKFEPFITFTREYSQKDNRNCRYCPDLEVCRRCPLIAISDLEAIYRCQLARNLLSALRPNLNRNTAIEIKNYISWELNGNILRITIHKNGYINEKKLELDSLIKDVWLEIRGRSSILDVELRLKKRWKTMKESEIRNLLHEFIDYFWKEGIIALL